LLPEELELATGSGFVVDDSNDERSA